MKPTDQATNETEQATVRYRPIISTDGIFALEAVVVGDRAALGEHPARQLRALVATAATQGRLMFMTLEPGDLDDEHLYSRLAPLSQVAGKVVLQLRTRPPAGQDGLLDARISRLRQLGFRLCASDVGAADGAIASAPVIWPDFIRLGGPLVESIHGSRVLRGVVADLCTLYRQSQMEVIAEGVTSAVQAATLRELGCTLLQGSLFDQEPGR